MSNMTSVEQKALAIAEVAAGLVQASVGTGGASMEVVSTKFDTAYAHVKRHVNNEIRSVTS